MISSKIVHQINEVVSLSLVCFFGYLNQDVAYSISANTFRGNYSFLNLEIAENLNSCRKFQFST